jgi:hypothetical protein
MHATKDALNTAMQNFKSAVATDAFLNAVPKARIVEGRMKVTFHGQ